VPEALEAPEPVVGVDKVTPFAYAELHLAEWYLSQQEASLSILNSSPQKFDSTRTS